jgi:hypothetical protein
MYQSGFAISTIRLVSLNELFVKVADQVTSSDHSDQRFLATRNVAFRASATLRASGYKERCADEGGRGGNRADCSEWRMSTSHRTQPFLVVISRLEPLRANWPE